MRCEQPSDSHVQQQAPQQAPQQAHTSSPTRTINVSDITVPHSAGSSSGVTEVRTSVPVTQSAVTPTATATTVNHTMGSHKRSAVTSPTRDQTLENYTPLRSVTLDSYLCLTGQLLQVSTLKRNRDQLAILIVWDGTKPRISLNKANLRDCSTRTHESGVIQNLPEYCVPIVVYGDHVQCALQMKLGDLYIIPG